MKEVEVQYRKIYEEIVEEVVDVRIRETGNPTSSELNNY